MNYVLITGASRNIGKAIAVRLRKDGYSVLMLDKANPEDPSLGEFHQVDLSNPTATAMTLERVLDGRQVTRLVNCAGVVDATSLESLDMDDFDRVVALNTRAYVQTTQALATVMKEAGFGRIVNIASRAALGSAELPLYSLSKGAVITFTRTMALALAPYGITCNAISPGPIETDMMRELYPIGSEKRAQYLPTIPVRHFGTPEDVAEVASFFLGEHTGFVTGQNLNVCGGLTVGIAHAL
jgi:NAD(P)-dependent dehydrogenase (short-subunit alcohol dehydrogenase family)